MPDSQPQSSTLSDPSPTANPPRLPLEPMDPQLTTIQPGGGLIIHLEQFWGRIRRAYLKTFRRSYLQKMAALRQGERNPCPHEVLDPRDMKFHQNQPGGYYWKPEDDPFRWRDNLPFARVGLAELVVFSTIFFGGALVLGAVTVQQNWSGLAVRVAWVGVAALVLLGLEIVWFFRNPDRKIPEGEGVVVSPADGKVVLIEELEYDESMGGPAVLIGIFLSIFNVHINRTPIAARVIGLKYKKGKFLNALKPESAKENEQLAIKIEGTQPPYRPMLVRQITGAIARRIVCWLKPGDELSKGEQIGMIKLGSRTELVLPKEPGLVIKTKVGNSVQAGSSILAEYEI
jgi:phosphatidylserine decarboxylase